MRICISATGNVARFESPEDREQLRVGTPIEGYVICLPDASAAPAWDAGVDEDFMGPVTISQPSGPNTLPLTVSRIARPGGVPFRIRQTFTRNINQNELTIEMGITNLSDSARSGVRLQRFFDADIDGDRGNDRFAASRNSVVAFEPGGSALSLTATTFALPHVAGAVSFANFDQGDWRVNCRSTGNVGPTMPGDYVGFAGYDLGTLAAGKTRTVRFIYRSF